MIENLQAIRDFLDACTAGPGADADLAGGDASAPDRQAPEPLRR